MFLSGSDFLACRQSTSRSDVVFPCHPSPASRSFPLQSFYIGETITTGCKIRSNAKIENGLVVRVALNASTMDISKKLHNCGWGVATGEMVIMTGS